MPNLIARGQHVEAALTLMAREGLIVSYNRTQGMARRWRVRLCVAPGSVSEKEIALDTVRDGELFVAGLESALYGLSAKVREWIDGARPGLLEELRAASEEDRQERASEAAAMTARARERYGDALNELRDDD